MATDPITVRAHDSAVLKEEAAIGAAIHRACKELPEPYALRIDLERGSGIVHWRCPNWNEHMIEDNGELFSDQIHAAIDAAIEDERRPGNGN